MEKNNGNYYRLIGCIFGLSTGMYLFDSSVAGMLSMAENPRERGAILRAGALRLPAYHGPLPERP